MGQPAKGLYTMFHAGADASAISQLLARSRPYDTMERRQHAPATPRAFLAHEVSSSASCKNWLGSQLGLACIDSTPSASGSKTQPAWCDSLPCLLPAFLPCGVVKTPPQTLYLHGALRSSALAVC